MSKGLKIMSLGVINHGMSLSVLYMYVLQDVAESLVTTVAPTITPHSFI
jgi:hypothetical protein